MLPLQHNWALFSCPIAPCRLFAALCSGAVMLWCYDEDASLWKCSGRTQQGAECCTYHIPLDGLHLPAGNCMVPAGRAGQYSALWSTSYINFLRGERSINV